MRIAVILAASLALVGCDLGRHYLRPGIDQVVCVESGDRLFFDLDESDASGCQWDYTCDDSDVEVTIDHIPPSSTVLGSASGRAEVMIRVHRGYDGPSTVTFRCRRSGRTGSVRKFAVTLYKRTGDAAFWE